MIRAYSHLYIMLRCNRVFLCTLIYVTELELLYMFCVTVKFLRFGIFMY